MMAFVHILHLYTASNYIFNRALHHHFLQYIFINLSVRFSFCSLIPVPHYSSVCDTLPQDSHFLATACHQTFGTSSTTSPPLSLHPSPSPSPCHPPSVKDGCPDYVLSSAQAGWQCPTLPVPVRDSINLLCIQSHRFSSRALKRAHARFH